MKRINHQQVCLQKNLGLLIALVIFFNVTASGQNFRTNGNAISNGNSCYTLTNNQNSQNGSIWSDNKIDLRFNFDINYSVYLGGSPAGADGMAFVLQRAGNTIQGSSGSGMGYGGISPSIAIEYDTYINSDFQAYDPLYDHMALMVNGEYHHYYNGVGVNPVPLTNLSGGNVKDGNFHTSRVTWNATSKVMTVYFDGVQKFTYNNDIVLNYFGNDPAVYFGFTASTGGLSNLHAVCMAQSTFQTFGATPPPQPVIAAGGATTFCAGGSVSLFSSAAKNNLNFSNSYVEAPSTPAISLTNALSIEAWVKTDNAAATQYIVTKGINDQTNGQYGLVLVNGIVQFHMWQNGHQGAVGVTQLASGVWYHLAGTWDGTTASVYINGVLDSQSSFVGPMTANSEPLRIGILGLPCCPYPFYGAIDEVRIWNRARTASEINAYKNKSVIADASLVAYYKLDEGNGATTADAAKGNTGTLVNAPTWQLSGAGINYNSYLWSNGASTPSIAASASGSYSVAVTDEYGVTGSSTPVSVTVNPLPSTAINISGSTNLCSGGFVTLVAPAPPSGGTYVWSNQQTSQSIQVFASGNYSVTITDGNGCSATSAPVTVSASALPAPVISASGPLSFCSGGSVTLTASAATSYSWARFVNGTTTYGIAASQSLVITEPGSYYVTVSDANGCTQSSGILSVTVNPLPVVSVTANGATTFCSGGSVLLTSSSATGNEWSNGSVSQSISVSETGNYLVKVTDLNGCSSTSSSISVTVHALPVVSVSADGPTIFCSGGAVRLTSSSATGNVWSTGSTSNFITVNQSGGYSVSVTDANGCTSTSPNLAVSVNPLPVVTISPSGPTTFCEGGSVILRSSSETGNVWSTGATSSSITISQSGNYSVVVTDGNGCSAGSSLTSVTVNPLPIVAVSAGGSTSFCPGGSVILTSSAATNNLWNVGGQSAQSINVTQSGSYQVTVTDGNGCSSTSSPVLVSADDNTAPVPSVAVLPTITISTTDNLVAPTAVDNCTEGLITAITADPMNYAFPGTYTVNWKYTDNALNQTVQIQTVIVEDRIAPTMRTMTSIVKNNDPGVCGARVNYELPVSSDNVSTTKVSISEGGGDGTIEFNTPVSDNVSGLNFVSSGEYQDIVHGHGIDISIAIQLFNPLTNSWTLVKTVQTGNGDYHFGGTSIHFPVISRVSKIRFVASQPIYAAFHFYEMEINLNSINLVQLTGLPSGSVFPIGATVNTFRAIDLAGNAATASFTVTIIENEKPVIGAVSNSVHNADANGVWVGSGASISISDNCPSSLSVSEQYFDQRGNRFYMGQSLRTPGNYVLGARTFPLGTNTVEITVTDAAGNVSQVTRFTVQVKDVSDPFIIAPANITQSSDPGTCGAYVKVPAPVTGDNCSVQSVVNSINGGPGASGRYPVGVTTITWTVTDGSGNKATATQTITVTDNEPPVITSLPTAIIQTNNAGSCGAVVNWAPARATDNCSVISFISDHQSGETFPIGETIVNFTATDRNLNTTTASFTITVTDNEAPKVITRPLTVALVNGAASIRASDIDNGSFDNCGSITLSASKTVFTCADAGVNTVTLTVTDAHGNTAGATALVTVIGQAPSSTIVVIPSSAVYTGGIPTDIYLGYGPQSVTLNNNTGTGTSPITYQWSGNGALSCTSCPSPVFTPTTAGTFTFTATATNQYGCSVTKSVTLCVRDIRVTPVANSRVYVCHTDLATGTKQTLTLATNTVGTQLLANPQDKLGACGMMPCGTNQQQAAKPQTLMPAAEGLVKTELKSTKLPQPVPERLAVKVFPNPSSNVFTFMITTARNAPVHLRLIDANGRVTEGVTNAPVNRMFTVGSKLVSGVYFAEVIQGQEKVVIKLIKQN